MYVVVIGLQETNFVFVLISHKIQHFSFMTFRVLHASQINLIVRTCFISIFDGLPFLDISNGLGPVVQSIISFTSPLRGQLVKCFSTL